MSTSQLLTRARLLLGRYPILWVPALLAQTVQAAGSLPGPGPGAQWLVLGAALLASGLIEGGQIAMIAQAWGRPGAPEGERKPSWKAFGEAVNARFVPLVMGQLGFVALMAALAGAGLAAGHLRYGLAPLVSWVRRLGALKPEELAGALQVSALPPGIAGWAGVLSLTLLAMTLAAGLLLFWQPLVVLRGRSAPAAFLGSARLFFARFKLVAGLALLQAFLTGLTMLAAAGGPLAAFIALGLLLAIGVFFKIAYTAIVLESVPEPEAPRPAA